MRIVEKLTGTRAETCPWFAFHDPLVADVLNVYPFFESGQLAFAAGRNPPALLVEAVREYHAAMGRAADALKREKDGQREHDAGHAAAVRQMGALYGVR